MATSTANIYPIYPSAPQISWSGTITAANTAKDGTGTVNTIFTGATDGSICNKVYCKPIGTNTASVLRLFINNGSSNATPANNSLFFEFSLPGTTLSEVAQQNTIELNINLPIPSGYKINAVIATTVAAGWVFTAAGGNY